MASIAGHIDGELSCLPSIGTPSGVQAGAPKPLQVLGLPVEVLQDHLLPQLRRQGRGVQAAFASTCRTAHQHVMGAVAQPMMGHLRRHFQGDPSAGEARIISPSLGTHPTALAYAATARLTHLFELHGSRTAPVALPKRCSMHPSAALDVVEEALESVLNGAGKGPCALPEFLETALSCLKRSMQGPLQGWVENEESASSANILGFRRTQSMVLEQAGHRVVQLDLGLFSRPRTLPPVWLYFSKLRVLECRNANLTQLPEAMGHLRQLESLDLSHSRLTTLPESLQYLPLDRLLLRNNRFEAIPDVVERLFKLRTLDLFGNPLVNPAFSANLGGLTVLDIGSCGLSQVPTSVFALLALQRLGLCANQITALPDDLRYLSRLSFLDLSINRIQYLPAALISLTQLQGLYLHNNPLLALPVFLGSMPKLQQLSVSSGDDEGGPPTHSLMLPRWIGNMQAVGSGWYINRAQQLLALSIED